MSEYIPRGDYDRPIDLTKCRKNIAVRTTSFRYFHRQCTRNAVVDDKWCKQHSLEAKERRRAKSDAAYQAGMNNSPLMLLSKARERIGQLEAENKRLRGRSSGGPLL